MVKLTQDKVLTIRALAAEATISELARKFGVSRGCIRGVVEGINWKGARAYDKTQAQAQGRSKARC